MRRIWITKWAGYAAIAVALASCGGASYAKSPKDAAKDKDQTLRAMQDEMERSKTRLAIDGVQKPFYVEYRLLDIDVRSVTAAFGSVISSTTGRNRVMSVDVRVGDHHLDSSNFISEEAFHGFLGSPGDLGEVGIDGVRGQHDAVVRLQLRHQIADLGIPPEDIGEAGEELVVRT